MNTETTETINDNVVGIDEVQAKREAKNERKRQQRAAARQRAVEQKEKEAGFQKVQHPFRLKTKRRACFDLMNREKGATLEEGMKATGWSSNVVLSEYYEIAKACGAKVSHKGDAYHLQGGPR